jgi:Ser/Thr protein kinase RdoA (MazF antagonist)
MNRPQDGAILAAFGIDATALIGSGRQSRVYELNGGRILRVFRESNQVASLDALRLFLDGIDGRLPVATPWIERIDAEGRYTVERRLPGRSLLAMLPTLTGERRRSAVANFVAAAGISSAIRYPERDYGHILAEAPIRAATWTEFLGLGLERAIARNRGVIAGEIGDIDRLVGKARALLAPLPAHPAKALVHGDHFAGNVLMDDTLTVRALLDFSAYTLVGDPLYDTITAPIFLEMTPGAEDADIALARAFVRRHHGDAIAPASRFYRVHAAFAMADPGFAAEPYPGLYSWALATLRQLANDGLPE